MDKRGMLDRIVSMYAGGNKSRFAAMLGVSRQCITSWYDRNSFDTELVYEKCPGLSAHWLLTGRGEMTAAADTADAVTAMLDRIQALSGEVELLKRRSVKE